MPTTQKPHASPDSMEDMLTTAFTRAEDMFRERWTKVEEKVRESPTAAVLIAAGIGYCLHRLPLRSLLATNLKLLWAFAPPAAMAAVAGKAYHALEDKVHASNGAAQQRQRDRETAQMSA
jgi:hypothetical protein